MTEIKATTTTLRLIPLFCTLVSTLLNPLHATGTLYSDTWMHTNPILAYGLIPIYTSAFLCTFVILHDRFRRRSASIRLGDEAADDIVAGGYLAACVMEGDFLVGAGLMVLVVFLWVSMGGNPDVLGGFCSIPILVQIMVHFFFVLRAVGMYVVDIRAWIAGRRVKRGEGCICQHCGRLATEEQTAAPSKRVLEIEEGKTWTARREDDVRLLQEEEESDDTFVTAGSS